MGQSTAVSRSTTKKLDQEMIKVISDRWFVEGEESLIPANVRAETLAHYGNSNFGPCHRLSAEGRVCTTNLDVHLDHALHCSRSKYGRHQQGVNQLAILASRAGLEVSRNPSLMANGEGRILRADLAVTFGERVFYIDFSLRSPFVENPPRDATSHITRAVEQKKQKYDALCQQMQAEFVPFIMSSTGSLSEEAVEFLAILAALIAKNSAISYGRALADVKRFVIQPVLRRLAQDIMIAQNSVIRRHQGRQQPLPA